MIMKMFEGFEGLYGFDGFEVSGLAVLKVCIYVEHSKSNEIGFV